MNKAFLCKGSYYSFFEHILIKLSTLIVCLNDLVILSNNYLKMYLLPRIAQIILASNSRV